MIKIQVEESLAFVDDGVSEVIGPNRVYPLETLIKEAKSSGYRLRRMDIAEVHTEDNKEPFESPVLLFLNTVDNGSGDFAAIYLSGYNQILRGNDYKLCTYHLIE